MTETKIDPIAQVLAEVLAGHIERIRELEDERGSLFKKISELESQLAARERQDFYPSIPGAVPCSPLAPQGLGKPLG